MFMQTDHHNSLVLRPLYLNVNSAWSDNGSLPLSLSLSRSGPHNTLMAVMFWASKSTTAYYEQVALCLTGYLGYRVLAVSED